MSVSACEDGNDRIWRESSLAEDETCAREIVTQLNRLQDLGCDVKITDGSPTAASTSSRPCGRTRTPATGAPESPWTWRTPTAVLTTEGPSPD